MPKNVWLIIWAVALLAVEVAVGVLISPVAAIWLLVIAIPLGIFAYWRATKTKDITPLDVREFQNRIRKRKNICLS